ncbi:MAG: HAD family hydrolase [Thermoguttaceae bacterium]
MIIGVDFDNTIVCYDGLFRKLAVRQGLVPDSTPEAKNAVRDYLRGIGQEDRWTELQGYAYGPGMREARLFPGVLEFFDHCRRVGQEVFIISHRTRYPFLGQRHDLHQAARDFLAQHGFNDPARIGLAVDHIHFHESKQEKVAQINRVGCTHYIDDLPEILTAAELRSDIEKILFDPTGQQADYPGLTRVGSWRTIENYLLAQGV